MGVGVLVSGHHTDTNGGTGQGVALSPLDIVFVIATAVLWGTSEGSVGVALFGGVCSSGEKNQGVG